MDKSSHQVSYENGRNDMREQICALIAYHMEIAARHHGKGSDQHLRYKNLIGDIRYDQEKELEVQTINQIHHDHE